MTTAADTAKAPADPAELLRSRSYVVVLVLGALIGVPVSAVAYFFLKIVAESQSWAFTTLPTDLGMSGEPTWWPLVPLTVSGVLVALCLSRLPGTGGHKPAEGFKAAGPVAPIELPGIVAAAYITLSLGVVLGPEAPLIGIGSGLAVLAVTLLKRDAPHTAVVVIGAAGSFAAVSTLLGSPIVGAFLLMEAGGLGGPMMGVVLVPGLLAAGVGTLIFVGLDNWTGFGTFSLAIPNIPPFSSPTFTEFLWAVVIGLLATVVGTSIRRGALALQPLVEERRLMLTPLVGLGMGATAVLFATVTDHPSSEVLFSGQSALPGLITAAGSWTVGALVLLAVCKSVAYCLALSSFRGGPVFPGMFIGAAAGIALSHLPGLPMIAGVGMGIAAMTTVMLGLPLTAVLLATIFLSADGLALSPLIIVSAVVAYVAHARVAPAPEPRTAPNAAAEPPTAGRP
jgi:chloride channel protein, CIC family